ncbi:MAG: serine/threonine protein kinase [Myxococcota bacterium]|jgi:serine/threonine protein kinase|nr:serine/threonine protein kinase [Myxococcota bacterium]
MAEVIGTVLDGKYEIVRLLGEGGMGTVYEARHLLIGRKLAVKFLHAQYVTSAEVVARFQREAQAAAAIGHENIIEVTDMGAGPDGAPYIVMEYLNGRDVSQLLQDIGSLPAGRAAYILAQALSALEAAHQVGIIHRDLKPENIYLIDKPTRPDYVKLLDFGISKFRSLETAGMKGLTQTGTVLGTPYYMSPEQARGDVDLTPKSDIYAMGVILYQMVTGRLPFDAPNYNALLVKILTEDPVPPESIAPHLPPDLAHTIRIAMAREADRRFSDCIDFRNRLMPFLPGVTGEFDMEMSATSRNVVAVALSTGTGAATAVRTDAANQSRTGLGARAQSEIHPGTPMDLTGSGVNDMRNKLPLIIGSALGGSLLVIGTVVGVSMLGSSPSQTKAMGAETTTLSTDASLSEPVGDKVRLQISVSPTAARIFIDEVEVGAAPFIGSFAKDDVLHKVEVKADGFKNTAALVRFDRHQELSYTLEKDRSAKQPPDKPRKSSGKTRKIESQKSGGETKKTGSSPRRKPKRRIDDNDPWS